MTKISVILPSYLGDYPNCATNRVEKLKRAIQSFLDQTHPDKEILIVSDGCQETIDVVESFTDPNIKLIKIEKQPLFSGNVREAGLRQATGDIVTYLDGDDILLEHHLDTINQWFDLENYDWIYYNDFIRYTDMEGMPLAERDVYLAYGVIGTSAIAHRNNEECHWSSCHGYGHDFVFIQELIEKSSRYKKIHGCGYVVCHIPNSVDN